MNVDFAIDDVESNILLGILNLTPFEPIHPPAIGV